MRITDFTNPKSKADIKVFLYLLLTCIAYLPSEGQNYYTINGMRFEHIQMQDGLPSNNFGAFLQDSKGLIWLSTTEGLVRYDGSDFQPVKLNEETTVLMEGAHFSILFEDSRGYIWLGTTGRGIFRYNPRKNSFLHFPGDKKNLRVTSIAEDASGSICATTWDGFYRIVFPQRENPDSFKVLSYHPMTLPESLYRLADTLKQNGKRIAGLLYEENEDQHEQKFQIEESTTALILAVGLRKVTTSSGFVYKVGIKDCIGQDFWTMSLDKTYDSANFGPSRIQASLVDFLPGKYQLSFRYNMASNHEIPDYLFPYLGIQVFQLSIEESNYVRSQLVANRPETSIFEGMQLAVYTDADEVTWIGGKGGLIKMEIPDTLNGEVVTFKPFLTLPNQVGGIRSSQVSAIIESQRGGLWVGGNTFGKNGVWGKIVLEHFDRKEEQFTVYKDNLKSARLSLRTLHQWDDGHLWIGTYKGGDNKQAGVYDIQPPFVKQNEAGIPNTTFFSFNPDDLNLHSRGISFIEKDFSGSTWIGTSRKGLFKYNPGINIFRPYHLDPGEVPGEVHSVCFLQDEEGYLWIGTRNHGLYRYDLSTNDVRHYLKSEKGVYGLSSNVIIDLCLDGQDNIWVATSEGILHQYQPDTDDFLRYPVPADLNDPLFNEKRRVIYDLAVGVGNILWVSANNGLHHFNLLTQTFEKHYFQLKDKDNTWNSVPVHLFAKKDGNLLLEFSGRSLFEMAFDSFDNYKLKPLLDHPRTFTHIIQDRAENIWGATNHGLYALNTEMDSLRIYTQQDGLNTNKIRYVLPVGDSILWLTTIKGLSQLNLTNGQTNHYSSEAGLMFPFGSLRAQLTILQDGQIACSGKGGFHLFDSTKFKPNLISPKVVLTEFQISNQKVEFGEKSVLKQSITYTKRLVLKHDQNDLTFKFAGLHYSRPDKNTYRYQMEGYDDDWVDAGFSRQAFYTNLPPGKYTFQVLASNSDGIWSKQAASIQIRILPPWWRTWLAYFVYALIIFFLIRSLYVFLLRRKLAQAETERLRELDVLKTRLFTNVTHEFRTPLTVILGMAWQVKEDPKEWFSEGLAAITRSGQQLLELVNQMLDLSRIEAGQAAVQYQQGDVIAYLGYLVQSFQSYAVSKQVGLQLNKKVETLQMDYASDSLAKVVNNLLSNAIKFTPEDGQVTVNISANEEQLLLSIEDNGLGISEKHLPHIFDRFYQADDSSTRVGEGTGVGLALVKELINLMKGEISVASTVGVGTQFLITLPIANTAPLSQDEYVKKEDFQNLYVAPIPRKSDGDEEAPTVLIIEDNPDVANYTAACLQGKYQVSMAANGRIGVEKALENVPDMIICDVMMPEMDGYQVCHTLKSDERTSHIPIVMLTAKVDLESRMEGLRQGADAYLAKPFHREELDVRIDNLIGLRKKLQQLFVDFPNREVVEGSRFSQEDAFLQKLTTVVYDHIDEDSFGIPEICKELTVSRTQLHRKLKAITGRSASHVIRSIRLHRAKELILSSTQNISEIAYQTGFKNPSHFSASFVEEFKQTPTEMREKRNLEQ